MADEFKTKSGLRPDDNGVPFSITTSDVEKYLQQKVNVVRQSVNQPPINIKVYTTEPGKYFCPFMVALPTEVLQDPNNSSEDDEPSIFTPSKSSKKVLLRPEIFNLFKLYTYNADDEKAFFSNDWRNRTGVRRDGSNALKNLRCPRLTNTKDAEAVIFLIDPLRVFHDMLQYSGDKRQYRVNIKTLKKIRTGEFVYGVERNIANGKGNKKYKDIFINEINRKLRGGRNY